MSRLAFLTCGLVLGVVAAGLAQPASAPAIVEIRVHGNHSTPEADILALAGLSVGQPASDEVLEAARARVAASDRFESVAVRRLARSIDVPDDILVMVLVEERAGVTPDRLTPGWIRRVADGGMFVPVLRYDEGYGVTFGVQTALADLVGTGSRLSFPATWGGQRRVGAEFERPFDTPVLSRLSFGADLQQSEHPAFDVTERRTRLYGRLERRIGTATTLALDAGHDRVRFAGRRETVGHVGGELVVDTRVDPAFPRNAVWGRTGVERLDVETGTRRRLRTDVNGALGLPLGAVVGARAFLISTDGDLPAYEQTMIGGGLALRGFRRGYRVDDNAAGTSLWIARPFGSPLDVARHGLRVFVDWAAAYDAGRKWQDADYDRGAGIGWFANLMALNAYVDVGRGNGRWRAHVRFGTGF